MQKIGGRRRPSSSEAALLAVHSSVHGGMLRGTTAGAASYHSAVVLHAAAAVYTPFLADQMRGGCTPCSVRGYVAGVFSLPFLIHGCVHSPVFCWTNALYTAPQWLQPRRWQLQQQTLFHQQRLQQQRQWCQQDMQQAQVFVRQDKQQHLQESYSPQQLRHTPFEQHTWQARPLQELPVLPERQLQQQQQPLDQRHLQPYISATKEVRWKQQHKQQGDAPLQQQQHSRASAERQQNEKRRQCGEQAHVSVDKARQQQTCVQLQQLRRRQRHVFDVAQRSDGREAARMLWMIARILHPRAEAVAAALGVPAAAEAQQEATGAVAAGAPAALGRVSRPTIVAAAAGQNAGNMLDAAALVSLPSWTLRLLFSRLIKQQLARLTHQQQQHRQVFELPDTSNNYSQSLLRSDVELSLAALVCLVGPSDVARNTAFDAAASGVTCADAAARAAVSAGGAADLVARASPVNNSDPVATAAWADAADGITGDAVDAWEKLSLLKAATRPHADEEARVHRAFFAAAVQHVLCPAASSDIDRDASGSAVECENRGNSAVGSSKSSGSDQDFSCCTNVSSSSGAISRLNSSTSSTNGSYRSSRNGDTRRDLARTLAGAGDGGHAREDKAALYTGNQYLVSTPNTPCSPLYSRAAGRTRSLSDGSSDSTRGCCSAERWSVSCLIGDIQHGEGGEESSRKVRSGACSSSSSGSGLFQNVESLALLSQTAAALRCVSLPLLRAVVEHLSAVEKCLAQQDHQQRGARRQRQHRLDEQQKRQHTLGLPKTEGPPTQGEQLVTEEHAEQAGQRRPPPRRREALGVQQSTAEQHQGEEQQVLHELERQRYHAPIQQQQAQPQTQHMHAQRQHDGLTAGRLHDLKSPQWSSSREEIETQQQSKDTGGQGKERHTQDETRKSRRFSEGVKAVKIATSHALNDRRLSPAESDASCSLLLLRHVSVLYCSLGSLLIANTSAAAAALRSLPGEPRKRRLLGRAEPPHGDTSLQRRDFIETAVQQRDCSMQEPLQQQVPQPIRGLTQQRGLAVDRQEAAQQQQLQQELRLLQKRPPYTTKVLDKHQQTSEQREEQVVELEQKRLNSGQQTQPATVADQQLVTPPDFCGLMSLPHPQHEQHESLSSTVARSSLGVRASSMKGTASTRSTIAGKLLPLHALCWLLRGRLLAARLPCKLLKQPELQPKLCQQVLGQQDTSQQDGSKLNQRQQGGQQWLLRRESQVGTVHGRQEPMGEEPGLTEEQQHLHVVEQLARACVGAVEPTSRLQRLLKRQIQRLQQKQLQPEQDGQPLQEQQAWQQRYNMDKLPLVQQKQHAHPSEVHQSKRQQPLQHRDSADGRSPTLLRDSLLQPLAGTGVSQSFSPRNNMLTLLQRLVTEEQEAQQKCADAVLDVLVRLPQTAFSTSATAVLPVHGVATPAGTKQRGEPGAVLRVVSAASSSSNVDAVNCAAGAIAAVQTRRTATVAGATNSPAAAQASSLAWALSRLHVLMGHARPPGRYRRALDRLAAAVLAASISRCRQVQEQQCLHGQQQEETGKRLLQEHPTQRQKPQRPDQAPHGMRSSCVKPAAEHRCPHVLQHGPVLSSCGDGDGAETLHKFLLPLTSFLGLKRCLNVSFSLAAAGCFQEAFFKQLVNEMLTLLRQQRTSAEEPPARTAGGHITRVNSNVASAAAEADDVPPSQARTRPVGPGAAATAEALSGAIHHRTEEGCCRPSAVLTVDLLVSLLSTLGMLQLQHPLLVEKATAALVQQLQGRTAAQSSRPGEETAAVAYTLATATTWSSSDGAATSQGSVISGRAADVRGRIGASSGCNSVGKASSDTSRHSCRTDSRSRTTRSCNEASRDSNRNSRASTESSRIGASTCVSSSCSAEARSPLSDEELLQVLSRVYVALARLQHRPPSALQQLLNELMRRLAAASSDTAAEAPRHSADPQSRKETLSSADAPAYAEAYRLLRERSTWQEVAAIGHSCAVLQSTSPQLLLALRQIVACWLFSCRPPKAVVAHAVARAAAPRDATTPANSAVSLAARGSVGAASSAAVAESARAFPAARWATSVAPAYMNCASATAYPAAECAAALHSGQSPVYGLPADGGGTLHRSNVTAEQYQVDGSCSATSRKYHPSTAEQTLMGRQVENGFDVAFQKNRQQQCVWPHIAEGAPSRPDLQGLRQESEGQAADERDHQRKWRAIQLQQRQEEEPQMQQQRRQQRSGRQKEQRWKEQDQMRSMRQKEEEQSVCFSVWDRSGEADLRRFVGVFLWTFAACSDVSHDVFLQLLQLAAALTRRQTRGASPCALTCAAFDSDEPQHETSSTMAQQSDEERDCVVDQHQEQAARGNLQTAKICTVSVTQQQQPTGEQRRQPCLRLNQRETVGDLPQQNAGSDILQWRARQPAKGEQTDQVEKGEQLQVPRRRLMASRNGEEKRQQGGDDHGTLRGRQQPLSAAEAKWFTQVYYSFLAVAADLQVRQPECFSSPATALAAAAAACGLERETVELWKRNSCRSAHRPHLSQMQQRVKRVAEAAARAQGGVFSVEMEEPLCDQLGLTVDIRLQQQARKSEQVALCDQAQEGRNNMVFSRGFAAEGRDSRGTNGATETRMALAADSSAGTTAAVGVPQAARANSCVVTKPIAAATNVEGTDNAEAAQLVLDMATCRRSAPLGSAASAGEGGGGALSDEVGYGRKQVPPVLAAAPAASGVALRAEAAAGYSEARGCPLAQADKAAETAAEVEVRAETSSCTAGAAFAIEVLGPSHFCTSATPPAGPAPLASSATGVAKALHHCSQPEAAAAFCGSVSSNCVDRSQQRRLHLTCTDELLELPQPYTSRAVYVSDSGLTTMQLYYTFDGSTALKQRLLRLSGKPCLFLSFLLLEKMNDEQLQELLQCYLRNFSSAPWGRHSRTQPSPLQQGGSAACCNSSSTTVPAEDACACFARSTRTSSCNVRGSSSLSCSAVRKQFNTSGGSCIEADSSAGGQPPGKGNTGTWVRENSGSTREGTDSHEHACNTSSKAQTTPSHCTVGEAAALGSNFSRASSIRHHHYHHHHSKPNGSDVAAFDSRTGTRTNFWLSCSPSSGGGQQRRMCHFHTHVQASSTVRGPRSCRDSTGAFGWGKSRLAFRLDRCGSRSRWVMAKGVECCSESTSACEISHKAPIKSTKDLRQQTILWNREATRMLVSPLQVGGSAGRRWTEVTQERIGQSGPVNGRGGLSSARKDGKVNVYLQNRAFNEEGVPCVPSCLCGALLRSESATGAAAAMQMSSCTSASSRRLAPWLQSIEWWPRPVAEAAAGATPRFRESSRDSVNIESYSDESRRDDGRSRSSNSLKRGINRSNESATTFHDKNSRRTERGRNRVWAYSRVVQQQGRRRYAGVRAPGVLQQVCCLHRSYEMCTRRMARTNLRVSLPIRRTGFADAIAAAAVQLQKNYEHVLLHQERLPLVLEWLHAVASWRQASLQKQGYAQPQLALLQQLRQHQKRRHKETRHQSSLLLTPQACIYAVVESIRDAAPLLLLDACPPDQAPAVHFLQLAAAASSSAVVKSSNVTEDSNSCRRGPCWKGRRWKDARSQGLLLGQSLRAGRFEQQRVDRWLSRQWDAIQRQGQHQQYQQYPLVLYLLEALPGDDTMARLPFNLVAQDRLATWEKILASAGLPGNGGRTGLSEIHKMQALLPPPFRYTPRSAEKPK